MSQHELFEWFQKNNEVQPERFYTTKEIREALRQEGKPYISAYSSVVRLWESGYLEIEQEGFNGRSYRLKKKYLRIRV